MRESLTVLAILLILILSAALAVPYFVNWDSQRGLVEKQLSDLLGRPVKVQGGIDLKLLPTPYLRLSEVDVGGAKAQSKIKIDEIQLEMALPALLRGEVDFVEAKLVHPQLTLQIKDSGVPFALPLGKFSGRMRFERIAVDDGTLDLQDQATGRSYAFDHVSFGAEAVSLSGPFKASGRFSFAGEPSQFHFAAGEREGNRQPVKLILDETRQHPRADLDGSLIFPQSRAGAGLPVVDGQIKLAGHTSGDIILPWQLSGTLRGGLRKAAIHNLDLHLGEEDHGIEFTGSADFDFGARPRANATLKAHQLDLDRLLSAKGAPAPMQRIARALGKLVGSHDLMAFGMPVAVAWSADSAVLGGESLSGLSGGFSVADKEAAWLRFEADGPGKSHLLLDGDIETGAAAGFKGRLEASAGDVPRLIQWLGTNLPQYAALFKALPLQSIDVAGKTSLSSIGFVGEDLSLRLDQSVLTGTLAYTTSVGGAPARLFADVSASKVNLDSLPDLSALAGKAKGVDLSVRLYARAVRVGNIGQNGLDTGQITLRLEKSGKLAKLKNFTVSDLGGANISAHGQWDGTSGAIDASIDSAKLKEAAELLRHLAPGPASDALLARAPNLSPTHLTLSAQAEKTTKDALALKSLHLDGTVGATKIAADIGVDPRLPDDLVASGKLTAPDALALMRQIGFSALPLEGLGAGRVDVVAHGRFGKPFDAAVNAALAGTKLAFNGKVTSDLAAPQAKGTLHLESANLTPLLEATGLAFPGPTTQLAADLSGTVDDGRSLFSLSDISGRFAGMEIAGRLAYDAKQHHLTGALDADRLSLSNLAALALGELSPPQPGAVWSSGKFPPAIIDPPPTDLALTAKRFDLSPQLVGSNARFGLAISGDRTGLKLALQHVAMQLGNGSAAGDFTLRRDGASAAVAGHLKLANYALDLPDAKGRLSGDLDLAGTGNSVAAVISGLAGSGTLAFGDLILPKTDPAAMQHVFNAVEDDSLSLDKSEIDRALETELNKGQSQLGDVRFDVGLAAGVLRLSPKVADSQKLAPGVTESLQASVDLSSLALDQKTALTLLTLPRNWNGPPPQITLISKGALAAPVRSIESASFVNSLAARAIARESARIQAQEFDLHEQAFFYNRLKSERRRELAAEAAKRAALAKEAAAKKAAEQKRKAEEAARAAAPLAIERHPLPPPLPITPGPATRVPAPRVPVPTDPLAAGRY